MKKDIFYAITCLSFSIIIGGAVYEHLTVVPKWTAGPPASLAMFQGEFGLKPELFWMLIHPASLLLFVTTLIMHWKTPRKVFLVTVLTFYITVLIITSIYFVPELISITTTAYATTVDAELTKRAQLWETLSIIRLGLLIILAIILFIGLTKVNHSLIDKVHNKKLRIPVPANTFA